MKLQIVQTGSIGNCYLLIGETQTLIIEMGVKFSEVKKALNFDLSKVAGSVVSHSHQDHCKGISDAIKAGIEVYCGKEFESPSTKHHNLKPILNSLIRFKIGEFTVMPFDLKHDVPCLGFLIHHKECGNVVFITDTIYCPYKFENVNNWIIEANYCEDIVTKRRESGTFNAFVHDRVIRSHMSIQTCLELLESNDLSKTNNIVLIHLSDSNSDAEQFEEKVKKQTHTSVTVAVKNKIIEFNKEPF